LLEPGGTSAGDEKKEGALLFTGCAYSHGGKRGGFVWRSPLWKLKGTDSTQKECRRMAAGVDPSKRSKKGDAGGRRRESARSGSGHSVGEWE